MAVAAAVLLVAGPSYLAGVALGLELAHRRWHQ